MKKFLIILFLSLFPVSAVLPAERLVVLNSNGLEVLRALNAGDLAVGVSDVIKSAPAFWEKYTSLPLAGGWKSPDYEKILKLKATAVLAYKRSPGEASEKKLKSLGIKVFRYDFYKISSFPEEVREFASLIGREKEAEEFLKWWSGLYGEIRERSSGLKSLPKVYIEGYGPFKSSGPGSGFDEIIALAGGDNLAKGASIPYPEVDPEWVVSGNPDYIVKTVSLRDCYDNGCGKNLKSAVNEISSRKAIRTLNAVKEGRVIALSPDIGAGPRGIIGALELAKRMHPGHFADMEPSEYHSYYLKKFHGLSFSGVYIYPDNVTR